MFKNKKEIFSFRKYKAYGLASAVIASMFLAQGVVPIIRPFIKKQRCSYLKLTNSPPVLTDCDK